MSVPQASAAHAEEALDPGQRIVDAHHHLYERPGVRYLQSELKTDLNSGHNVCATVFVQARSMLRASGPEAMKPVGETEFASAVAEQCTSGEGGGVRVCAAIVGQANLMLGNAVHPVLVAHIAAGGGRFRGIRHIAAWDADGSLISPAYPTTEDLLATAAFRAGFAQLGSLGLSFDAWILSPQIPRLTALAQAFPTTPIVLNHCGGIVRIGRYALQKDEVFRQWSVALHKLAQCPNVMVKLGGLGMALSGFGFDTRRQAATSVELAAAWRPWIEHCIELFGPGRCMFESNFPADRDSYAYGTGWNAMKRLASGLPQSDKEDLFWRSASRFYRLPPP
jgi:L-fuconolactonase